MATKIHIDKVFLISELKKEYRASSVAKKLGVSKDVILSRIKEYDIDIMRCRFNYNFFSKIDTEEKAYWLGYLTADGHVTSNKNDGLVTISSKDIEHIEKYKKSIEYNGKIKIYNKKYAFIGISHHKIKNDLLKYGVTPNKTYELKPPNIKLLPEHLINHYIRGFFDGDGCITSYIRQRDNRIVAKINFVCGSKDYLEWLNNIFKTSNTVCKRKSKTRNINHYNLDIGKVSDILRIMDWIYKDTTLQLDRKFEKWLKIKHRLEIDYKNNNKINKSNTPRFFAFNEMKTLSEWAVDVRCKTTRLGLYHRLRNGWDIEIAITTEKLPFKNNNK